LGLRFFFYRGVTEGGQTRKARKQSVRLSRAIIFENGTSLTFLEMKDGTV